MSHFFASIIIIKSILSLILEVAHAKIVEGHLVVSERWFFVTRFCFLSEQGQFEYFIEYSKEYAVQNLLLYFDSDTQWPAVYKSQKTCEEKEAVLSIQQNQVVNLTDMEYGTGCTTIRSQHGLASADKKALISCHLVRKFHSMRPRWWFLAVSHCNSTNGLNLKYKFYMTNGAPGNIWKEHFSADEFCILPLLIIFFVLYLIILVAAVGCTVNDRNVPCVFLWDSKMAAPKPVAENKHSIKIEDLDVTGNWSIGHSDREEISAELKSRQLLHSTYKLFIISILLEEIGIGLQFLAYFKYAYDGIGFPMVKLIGRMGESASEICFLLLLLLLAKGYTVTRGRLRLASSVKLTVFMCAYTATTIGLFIYEQEVFDPGEVLYLYESPAGYGVMILRIAAWWIFEYSTMFTLKHYPEKSNFYYPFNLMGTLWFVAGPCFTLIANSLIDKWIRESVVCAIYHFISFSGHSLFFLLTVPSKANKNFPYHVRTSQIDVMEVVNTVGNNTLYDFGQHPYAPYRPSRLSSTDVNSSRVDIPDVPIDLFSIKHNIIMKGNELKKSTQSNPDNAKASVQLEKKQEAFSISDATHVVSSPSGSVYEMTENRRRSSAAMTTDGVFPADTFVAPALRDKRVLSA